MRPLGAGKLGFGLAGIGVTTEGRIDAIDDKVIVIGRGRIAMDPVGIGEQF